MRSLRLTLAFVVLGLCVVFCLWAAGVLPYEQANETFRRIVFIVGGIGIAVSLVYVLMGGGKKPTSEESESSRDSLGNGPRF